MCECQCESLGAHWDQRKLSLVLTDSCFSEQISNWLCFVNTQVILVHLNILTAVRQKLLEPLLSIWSVVCVFIEESVMNVGWKQRADNGGRSGDDVNHLRVSTGDEGVVNDEN